MRVTTSVSPRRRNSISTSSSLRPLRLVPDAFSARITVHPAALSAARWMERSWSMELTRA